MTYEMETDPALRRDNGAVPGDVPDPEAAAAAESPDGGTPRDEAPAPVSPEEAAIEREAQATNRAWYVIRVQTGREEAVKTAIEKLKKARKLEDKIGEILVPAEKRTEIKAGRRQVRQHKLFPGYVIVSMELSNETWFAIRETPGVGDFLGLKDPIPLPEHEVHKLQASIRAAEEVPKVKVSFHKGDVVRVKNGPFENFEGSVEEINERKGVVKVSMVIFGRPTNVDLEYWQLEKA
jgi:transcriptional antiterminator NusG